jgi:phage gp45-like
LGSLRNLVSRLLRWGVTTAAMRDGGALPVQQVEYLGKRASAVPWFPYGYHANIPVGELEVLASLLGVSEMRVALPGSPSRRPKTLAVGEVALYHPGTGSRFHLLANGDVSVTAGASAALFAASGAITLTPGAGQKVLVAGDLEVTGAATLGGVVTSAGKDISDSHLHSGVQTGAGNTGPPV